MHVCPFDSCKKTFQKESRLNTHIRSHTGEKPFACTYEGCYKEYKRSDHLRRHILAAHWSDVQKDASTPPPVFRCEEENCTATFRSAQTLKKHVRRSHAANSYTCHWCGEVFKKHHQLTTHRAAHSEEKKHVCPEPGCDKSFTFPNKLRQHMKIHEGYTCSEPNCGEHFDKWTLLVKHRKIKHGTVHQCPKCQKVFSQKQWLKQHMKTHNEERVVYSCTYENCSREYLDLRNLNAHIRTYHGGKRFACYKPGCGMTFCTKQKLQYHLKFHDPSVPWPQKKKSKKRLMAEQLTGSIATKDSSSDDNDLDLNSPEMEERMTSHDLASLGHMVRCELGFETPKSKNSTHESTLQHTKETSTFTMLKSTATCDVISEHNISISSTSAKDCENNNITQHNKHETSSTVTGYCDSESASENFTCSEKNTSVDLTMTCKESAYKSKHTVTSKSEYTNNVMGYVENTSEHLTCENSDKNRTYRENTSGSSTCGESTGENLISIENVSENLTCSSTLSNSISANNRDIIDAIS